MSDASWLPPVDHHLDGWRVTLLRQHQDGLPVTIGVVVLSAEPGEGTAGVRLTADVLSSAADLVEAEAARVAAVAAGRLGRVAAIYRQAVDDGVRPVKAVAAEFGVTDGSAGNLVMRARQEGLLKPTTPGRVAA